MSKESCWLCGCEKKLCESHVIPKFVFRWLIKTGGTPYLRHGNKPNRRIQDGDKHKLYCLDCEARFNRYETNFKSKIFAPATLRECLPNRYGSWLSRYTATLTLRTIHSQKFRQIDEKYSANLIKRINTSERVWREFLLGIRKNPGPHKLYLYYPGYFDHFDAEALPKNWNTYIQRSVERDIIFSEDEQFCAVYIKTGPLIFLGTVADSKNVLGKDFLRCNEGNLPKNPLSISGSVWEHLLFRAKNSSEILNSISEKQKFISQNEVMKRIEEFTDSDQAKTLVKDLKQFGPQ